MHTIDTGRADRERRRPPPATASGTTSASFGVGILLDQPLAEILPEPGSVLVVAPAALRHRQIPQPHGKVLYDTA